MSKLLVVLSDTVLLGANLGMGPVSLSVRMLAGSLPSAAVVKQLKSVSGTSFLTLSRALTMMVGVPAPLLGRPLGTQVFSKTAILIKRCLLTYV